MSIDKRFWLRAALALGVLLALLGAYGWHQWQHWAPSRVQYPVQGLALSATQGEVNWGSLRAANPDFVYIRAVSGQGTRDQAFSRNWAGAQSSGIRYGAEILFDPCYPASDLATAFMATVSRENSALPAAIRIDAASNCKSEPGRDKVVSELNTLINLVEAHMGKPALIHVSPAAEKHYGISASINRTLWLDRAWFKPTYASHDWVMWTANPSRQIKGVSAPVEWIVVKQ